MSASKDAAPVLFGAELQFTLLLVTIEPGTATVPLRNRVEIRDNGVHAAVVEVHNVVTVGVRSEVAIGMVPDGGKIESMSKNESVVTRECQHSTSIFQRADSPRHKQVVIGPDGFPGPD